MPEFTYPAPAKTTIDIPVSYSFAFEGERVRDKDLQAEFGGREGLSLELLTCKNDDVINDGSVELIGPDIDQLQKERALAPLAVIVDVYGRKMQKDFEPVLERQIHRFINYAFGIMHAGQRDKCSLRISREAFLNGFRLRHIGIILHAMLRQEFSTIVDKAQVKLYTRREDVEKLVNGARKVFDERDRRSSGKSDESTDTYYSCLICQSFAPNHICIITPERPGLCGAYSWLDALASSEITPAGPNQPVFKGRALDKRLGQWENINKYLAGKTSGKISKVSLYSLVDHPMTSNWLSECVVAVIPEANGVMVVNRGYAGMTPLGMSFDELTESAGSGIQSPGFLGVARLYILSAKFILAEGGIKRLVWMPSELKESLKEGLDALSAGINDPDLPDKIADEKAAQTLDELVDYLAKVRHPALYMDPLV